MKKINSQLFKVQSSPLPFNLDYLIGYSLKNSVHLPSGKTRFDLTTSFSCKMVLSPIQVSRDFPNGYYLKTAFVF